MVIMNRELPDHAVLVATYKGTAHRCTVHLSEGARRYRLEDGREFASPSSAATTLVGSNRNGWQFWSVEGTAVAAPESAAAVTAPKASRAKPAFRNLKRTPNQMGCPEGQSRWYCSTCQKGFFVGADVKAEICPEGHGTDMPDGWDTPAAT
jgi:hypothetical protein